MVNCWCGSRWFGILGVHPSNNPFHFRGIPGIQTNKLTISWKMLGFFEPLKVLWIRGVKFHCCCVKFTPEIGDFSTRGPWPARRAQAPPAWSRVEARKFLLKRKKRSRRITWHRPETAATIRISTGMPRCGCFFFWKIALEGLKMMIIHTVFLWFLAVDINPSWIENSKKVAKIYQAKDWFGRNLFGVLKKNSTLLCQLFWKEGVLEK